MSKSVDLPCTNSGKKLWARTLPLGSLRSFAIGDSPIEMFCHLSIFSPVGLVRRIGLLWAFLCTRPSKQVFR
ncbi:hypothetical protein AAZX31_02G056400 [Glycine max]